MGHKCSSSTNIPRLGVSRLWQSCSSSVPRCRLPRSSWSSGLSDLRSSSPHLRPSRQSCQATRCTKDSMASMKTRKGRSGQRRQEHRLASAPCGERSRSAELRRAPGAAPDTHLAAGGALLLWDMVFQELLGVHDDVLWVLALVPDRLQFGPEAAQRGGEALRLRGGKLLEEQPHQGDASGRSVTPPELVSCTRQRCGFQSCCCCRCGGGGSLTCSQFLPGRSLECRIWNLLPVWEEEGRRPQHPDAFRSDHSARENLHTSRPLSSS